MQSTTPNSKWRIALISNPLWLAEKLLPQLRQLGHEPVSWLRPKRPSNRPQPCEADIAHCAALNRVSLCMACDVREVAPLLRKIEPDLVMCWGFPWKLPQEALDVAPLGSINQHPSRLPGG